jgi:hypothetical protein
MSKFTKRDEKIFDDLKECFKESGLPIKGETMLGNLMVIESEFHYPDYPINILIMLDPAEDTVMFGIHYGATLSAIRTVLYELIDRINMYLCTTHFVVHPDTGQLILTSGMFFTDDVINKKEFHLLFKQLLADSYNYFPLIGMQLESDKTPAEMWEQFLIENKDRIV